MLVARCARTAGLVKVKAIRNGNMWIVVTRTKAGLNINFHDSATQEALTAWLHRWYPQEYGRGSDCWHRERARMMELVRALRLDP